MTALHLSLFALSLSKGSPEPVEGPSLRSVEGFDFGQPERIGDIRR
jgi:hypothetical protein